MKTDQRYDHSIYEEIQSMSVRSTHWRLRMRSSAWRPPTDVYETEDAILIRVEIGDMKEDDFDIELQGHLLSIRGIRQDTLDKVDYHQVEIRFGEFYIDIHLPAPVVADRVKADYDNGFLLITLPKARSRQVPVEK
ncbi:MAG: Hsp20/alpha crystallin family protein [Chloroflexota bacterium]|nr:Hsp20/alpha crystallin family protein [Chloroflexota bacterium]